MLSLVYCLLCVTINVFAIYAVEDFQVYPISRIRAYQRDKRNEVDGTLPISELFMNYTSNGLFPIDGPMDNQIASSGLPGFESLDEVGLDRWPFYQLAVDYNKDFNVTEFHVLWKIEPALREPYHFHLHVGNYETYHSARPLRRSMFDLTERCHYNTTLDLALREYIHVTCMEKGRLFMPYKAVSLLLVWKVDSREEYYYRIADVVPMPMTTGQMLIFNGGTLQEVAALQRNPVTIERAIDEYALYCAAYVESITRPSGASVSLNLNNDIEEPNTLPLPMSYVNKSDHATGIVNTTAFVNYTHPIAVLRYPMPRDTANRLGYNEKCKNESTVKKTLPDYPDNELPFLLIDCWKKVKLYYFYDTKKDFTYYKITWLISRMNMHVNAYLHFVPWPAMRYDKMIPVKRTMLYNSRNCEIQFQIQNNATVYNSSGVMDAYTFTCLDKGKGLLKPLKSVSMFARLIINNDARMEYQVADVLPVPVSSMKEFNDAKVDFSEIVTLNNVASLYKYGQCEE